MRQAGRCFLTFQKVRLFLTMVLKKFTSLLQIFVIERFSLQNQQVPVPQKECTLGTILCYNQVPIPNYLSCTYGTLFFIFQYLPYMVFNQYLMLNVWQALVFSGKIKDRSRAIFGTGDNLRVVTVTANSGESRSLSLPTQVSHGHFHC